ncbi:MAG: hypothetical protein M3220_13120 [Chloroflexota bacterium]|nr:hypothetical protein [Chloroflexota bacterium]
MLTEDPFEPPLMDESVRLKAGHTPPDAPTVQLIVAPARAREFAEWGVPVSFLY